MIIKLFLKNGIEVISTVRREKYIDELKEIGSKYTLLSSHLDDYKNELKKVSEILQPLIAFECVGGDQTSLILNNIRENGTLYHYGNLSLRSISNIQTVDLLFKNKVIRGFWIVSYLNSLNAEKREEIVNMLLDLKVNSNIFNTNIISTFKPNDFDNAINDYRHEMGNGKVLFDFSR